jgi:hypothetical protein
MGQGIWATVNYSVKSIASYPTRAAIKRDRVTSGAIRGKRNPRARLKGAVTHRRIPPMFSTEPNTVFDPENRAILRLSRLLGALGLQPAE